MLQVSLGTAFLGLELSLDPTVRHQIILGFAGAFTYASGKLWHRAFRTEAFSGSYSTP